MRTAAEQGAPDTAGVTGRSATSAVNRAVAGVPARLRAVRTQRGMTLLEVTQQTGISKSTLSRLETGQRRPTLQLLLALSMTYRVPLDDLVGAPEVGDPRIRLGSGQMKGRTVIPLSQEPGSMQAWKIVIPVSQVDPQARAHDGHEWIYVLSGRVRLVLGEHDSVLDPGDVVEFDTQVPHWFGSTGAEPAEILSIFGRPGERMRHRPPGR
jgi:transcriptional regulator with XRE-family HTH domain